MSVYDIVMVIIFFGAVIFGFRKGLAWQVASLLSIVLSYFVALNFRRPVAALISAQEPWNQFAAMLILFLGTSLVVWTVFASFSRSIKKMNMGGFDRQAGAILGAIKGGILCMLATVFAVSLFDSTSNMVHNSKSGHYVVSGIRQFARFTPGELAPYLQPHIQGFDQAIGPTPTKQPLFNSNKNDTTPSTGGFHTGGFQVNQNIGFQGNPGTAPTQVGGGFLNATTQTQPTTSRYPGQFQTGQFQTPTTQQSSDTGFGFNRTATNQTPQTNQNYNRNTPYSQNAPNNPTQENNGNFYSTGFGNQQYGNQNTQPQTNQNNGQIYQQPTQNGLGQQQQGQQRITTGQNGWPEINTTINAKDLIQRGAETTAEMLRRAYESNVQPQ